VEQITFSGREALKRSQTAVYVTERAVFRLTPDGVTLTEIAPGVDLRRDILERMQFAPHVPREPALMPVEHFRA
jgi:acyl CoA:acetate/3-ketoacid CoA transferase